MLLAVNMGNTLIHIGVLDQGKLVLDEHFSTDLKKTDTEYAVLLHTLLELNNLSNQDLTGAILSSVVPPMTTVLTKAVQKASGLMPLVVGPGVKNGLKIKIDDPKTLGADIVVDTVGAADLYEAPLLVIHLGTATTITYLDRDKNYCGGAIIPGMKIALNALVSHASQLPNVSLDHPKKTIGRNTIDALKSGSLYGHAAMIDGMIDRIAGERGANPPFLVATGEVSELVIPYCLHDIKINRHLSFHGLEVIYEKNRDQSISRTTKI